MNIPVNTKDNTKELIEKLTARCIESINNGGRNLAWISWQDTSREIARKIADAFIAKGYHAKEYICRGSGWSTTYIATYVMSGGSAPMAYEIVLG